MPNWHIHIVITTACCESSGRKSASRHSNEVHNHESKSCRERPTRTSAAREAHSRVETQSVTSTLPPVKSRNDYCEYTHTHTYHRRDTYMEGTP